MTRNNFKIWALAFVTLVGVMIFIELGYWMGQTIPNSNIIESESPLSVISGAILSLLSFMLAFIFGILYNRFDARKELVRVEANAIATARLRADFILEPGRSKLIKLFEEYIILRVAAAESLSLDKIQSALNSSVLIQQQIWNIAVEQVRKEMNPQIDSIMIQSLNNMFDIHSMRIMRGYQARTTTGLWVTLYTLLISSMISIGYQAGVAGSGRVLVIFLLAISFTFVFTLILALDNPTYGYFKIPQVPLKNLLNYMKSHSTDLSNGPINTDVKKELL